MILFLQLISIYSERIGMIAKNMTYEELPDVLDTQLAADYLGLSRETVQEYAREGRLRAARCGRTYRIRREWLVDFLDAAADRNCDGR